MQMGNEEYPPMPIIKEGLLNKRKIKDLTIELQIVTTESKNLNIFSFDKEDEGILIRFIWF